MSLEVNLEAAQDAVDYIKGLGLKTCNKISDRIAAAGGIENVIGTDQGTRKYVKGVAGPATLGPAGDGIARVRSVTYRNIRDRVGHYIAEGFGNCGEQAQIAFLYLYDKGIRPLDLMWFTKTQQVDPNDPYDHCWVGVGLIKGCQYSDLRTWGKEAVWCDPWQGDGVAFSIDDLIRGKVRNLNFIYKCDTWERVNKGKPDSMMRYD